MRKFIDLEEIDTENILAIARKCEYEVCVEYIDGYTVLHDGGCLEALLNDGGVEFLDTDDKFYYYKLNDIKFKVPYELINEDEEGNSDSYLFFSLKEII